MFDIWFINDLLYLYLYLYLYLIITERLTFSDLALVYW